MNRGIFYRSQVLISVVTFLAVLFSLTGCYYQLDEQTYHILLEDAAQEEITSIEIHEGQTVLAPPLITPTLIDGGYGLRNCSPLQEKRINDAMSILLHIQATSPGFQAFHACMQSAPLVEFSCSRREGAYEQGRNRAANSLREQHFTLITCDDLDPDVLAHAPVSIDGEELTIDHSFALGGDITTIAGTIAHEIMHNRGYRHSRFDFGSDYYWNTVPEQVGACVQYGRANAAAGPAAWGFCTSFDKGGDSLAAGDINRDGTDEILVAEDDGGLIEVYSYRGIFVGSIKTSFDRGGDDIAVANIVGDGRAEILVAEDDGGAIDVYNSEGLRLLRSAPGSECRSTFDHGGDGLAAGDVNDDGRDEILVAEDDGGKVRIFRPQILSDSEVCLKLHTSIVTQFDGGDSLSVGDVNGDGRDEILVAEDDGGVVSIYADSGTHLCEIKTSFDKGGDDIAAANVYGDNRAEILVAEDNGGAIDVYQVNVDCR